MVSLEFGACLLWSSSLPFQCALARRYRLHTDPSAWVWFGRHNVRRGTCAQRRALGRCIIDWFVWKHFGDMSQLKCVWSFESNWNLILQSLAAKGQQALQASNGKAQSDHKNQQYQIAIINLAYCVLLTFRGNVIMPPQRWYIVSYSNIQRYIFSYSNMLNIKEFLRFHHLCYIFVLFPISYLSPKYSILNG